MHRGGTGRRRLRALGACILLALIGAPDGLAGEWENMRESYDNKLRTHARRIAEIEARDRGADQEKRADRLTRDRINGIKGSLKGGGKARSLAETAEKASGDARSLIDVSREQGEYLDIVISEWGTEGAERKKLRESIATLQKNLESTNANLARVIEDAETTTTRVPRSGVLDKVARIQAAEKERTRWLRTGRAGAGTPAERARRRGARAGRAVRL
jgi:hypothetical protein